MKIPFFFKLMACLLFRIMIGKGGVFMKTLYKQVESRLKELDFEAIWPGFHRFPFSLYNEQQAVFEGEIIAAPKEFRGNTSVSWNGRRLAIWNISLDPPRDLDCFTAGIVHEMFHAFQMEQGEARFPDDLRLACTVQTPESMALKEREMGLLADGGDLAKIFALRRRRSRLLEPFIREEWLAETLEGMAEYAFLRSLAQLSPEKGAQALREKREILRRGGDSLLDIRRTAYQSGALLLELTGESGVELYHSIGRETQSVYEYIARAVPMEDGDPPAPGACRFWEARLREQREGRYARLRRFYGAPRQTVQGTFQIRGYDPMNLWRQDDTLYCGTFLSLLDGGGKTVELPGESVLRMDPEDPHRARAYTH